MSDGGYMSTDGDIRSIQGAATIFGWILFGSALVLLSPFALEPLKIRLNAIFQEITPAQIRNFTLLAYIVSWVVAMRVDLYLHKTAYQGDAGKRGVVSLGASIAIVLVAVAIVLILSRQSIVWLVISLNFFFVTNFVAWLQVLKLENKLIASTRLSLDEGIESAPKLEYLNIIASYIGGRWQWYRFCGMLIILCVVNIIALSAGARGTIAKLLGLDISALPEGRLEALLPDFSVLLFVLFAETWSWAVRIATVARLRGLAKWSLYDHPRLAEYMVQFFDQQFKTVNYLMIAHAAALLATLTVVKDFLSSPKNQAGFADLVSLAPTIGSFAGYFSWGLALAVLAYVTLSIARDTVMSAVILNSHNAPNRAPSYVSLTLCAGSALLLLLGMFTVASQVGGVRIPI